MYRIQYRHESGVYRTYGTFVGMDNPNAAAPGTGYRQAPWLSFSNTTANTPTDKWYARPRSDPRTFRFQFFPTPSGPLELPAQEAGLLKRQQRAFQAFKALR